MPLQLTQQTKTMQSLVMTAQLQQAIRILQLSSPDLAAEIERAFLENPLLEMEEGDGASVQDTPVHDEERTRIEDAFAVAYDADDPYEAEARQEGVHMDFAAPVALSLEEELLREVDVRFANLSEKAIAVFLVGSLDERGYLVVPLAEAARATGTDEASVERILRVLQSFDPAGIGARDLAECMRLQAERTGLYHGLLRAVIERHLRAVAEGRYREIARAEGASLAEVQMAVDILRSFSPKPGSAYGGEPPAYIRPDVRVVRVDGRMEVIVCEEHLPRLRVSRLYQRAGEMDTETRDYIAQRIYAARAFIRSIEQRSETLRRVTEELVRRQADFVLHGAGALHPLTMQNVAAALGMHESTVSRAVANKYIDLPRGLVSLKAFFSTAVGAEADGTHSAEQVRTAIRAIVEAEDAANPLSDARIMELLAVRGIAAARRTVMKYREQLGIPSSAKRRRY
ncbi:RNA polymerase factor sigma-54 [uncultured Selenomonas sp.]|uniref:RNA polymerase factor sigma-54 n=1 Tax=uncultured Selenomonas sp. TaxID=159275 RepID=UPI002676AF31|nr:RNA polymerase factor sigma-54 [uncultured Selenomonas sp.]